MKIDTNICWYATYEDVIDGSFKSVNGLNFIDAVKQGYDIFPSLDYFFGWPNENLLFNSEGKRLRLFQVSLHKCIFVHMPNSFPIKALSFDVIDEFNILDIYSDECEQIMFDVEDGLIKRIYNGAFGYNQIIEYDENKSPVKIVTNARMGGKTVNIIKHES